MDKKKQLKDEAAAKGLTGRKASTYVHAGLKKAGVKGQGKKQYGRGRPLGS